MSTFDQLVKTIDCKALLINLLVLMGHLPTDEEAADFMMRLLDILVDKGFAPDACGYNAATTQVVLAYKYVGEMAQVRTALETAVKEAEQLARREARRRDAGFAHLKKFPTKS